MAVTIVIPQEADFCHIGSSFAITQRDVRKDFVYDLRNKERMVFHLIQQLASRGFVSAVQYPEKIWKMSIVFYLRSECVSLQQKWNHF